MSETVSLARSIVSMQAASIRQALSAETLKQNAQAEQGVVAMLRQSLEQSQATLPAGQGALARWSTGPPEPFPVFAQPVAKRRRCA